VCRHRQGQGTYLAWIGGTAPYFHNGSAATLLDVVEFYNQRFNLGFTDQQKSDLVPVLKNFVDGEERKCALLAQSRLFDGIDCVRFERQSGNRHLALDVRS
jgi:hypothetical protein